MSILDLFHRQFRAAIATDEIVRQQAGTPVTSVGRLAKSRVPKTVGVSLAVVATTILFGVSSKLAYSGQYQPIGADLTTPIVPGQPLGVTVQLDGSSAPVTIYSDPPGAVSYQGTINSGDTVQATTTSDCDPSSVTVYVATDGETVIAAEGPIDGD